MKKLKNKILISLLIAFCIISSVSLCMPVKANSEIGTSGSVKSSENTTFSFYNTCTLSYGVTGYFMDVQVSATASNNNNETITLEVYIVNRGVTKTYTFYSNNGTYTYNNIFLGFSGGSPVAFKFTGANPAIQLTVTLKFTS